MGNNRSKHKPLCLPMDFFSNKSARIWSGFEVRERGEGANTRKWPVRICIGPRKTAEGQEGSSRERGRLPEAEKIPGTRFGERGGASRSLDLSRFVRVRFCNYFAAGADEALGTAGRQSRTREARRWRKIFKVFIKLRGLDTAARATEITRNRTIVPARPVFKSLLDLGAPLMHGWRTNKSYFECGKVGTAPSWFRNRRKCRDRFLEPKQDSPVFPRLRRQTRKIRTA